MAKWTASNIQITKTERGLPGANKAVDYGFTSTISRDGVEHHKYNEPSFGGSGDIAAFVKQAVLNHLKVWEASDVLVTVLDVADVEYERKDPPPPTDEELLQQEIAVQTAILRNIKERVSLGLSDQSDYD